MKRFVKIMWKPMLWAAPLLLGMIGFWQAGEDVLQALFNCVCMYALNYQETPANILVEISRWLAPLATASNSSPFFFFNRPIFQPSIISR